jgi:hypothetical protein
MIPAGFVQALITYAEVKGDSGAAEIEAEFDALFAKVNAGEGTQLINSNVNGKAYGFAVSMTVEEKFTAFAEALKSINGTAVTTTYASFGGLER